jgi:AraC family transcriptional regulator of adaptative response / DNA-3-methyladenine glycosylase II
MDLTYLPPFDWIGILAFLERRALRGIEAVDNLGYTRTVRTSGGPAWIRIENDPERSTLRVSGDPAAEPLMAVIVPRLRALFDLDAVPEAVGAVLRRDRLLASAVASNPGLRVPGAFDGFELAVRAILGQQITVRAAATIGGRFAEAFGDRVETPFDDLTHLTPEPDRIARASVDDITSLGIIRMRARSIIAVAEECALGRIRLEPGEDGVETIARLLALPGIGPWTAQYIAMRALRLPDAFPKEDIALRNRLGRVTAARAEARSLGWRPFRSYATLHLWNLPDPQR